MPETVLPPEASATPPPAFADGVPLARPRGLALLRAGLGSRKAACMLGFGFSSGLPFALLIGTLNAWLGEAKIDLKTIGVLSWIGLAYAFKFLWAPAVDRVRLPGLDRLGRRRGWILLCQVVLAAGFAGLALTDPHVAIGRFAAIGFMAAFASATQDIAIDAWRIDVSGPDAPLDLMSALNQFGYRVASIVGGALALFMAARLPWPAVYAVMAGLMVLALVVTLSAPDTPRVRVAAERDEVALSPGVRAVLLTVVLVSWIWAVQRVVGFMVVELMPVAPGVKAPSVADFTRVSGPLVLLATVGVPLAVAALSNALARRRAVAVGAWNAVGDHLWSALVAPLAELTARVGWGVIVLIGFILTYALAYNIWAAFAYPFYLDALHYTKDEVAFASKIFGIFMTMGGIALGGVLFARLGAFPTLAIGVVLPAVGNLLYADLADGAPVIDGFIHALHLDVFGAAIGLTVRMERLLVAIAWENVATGVALTAFVAYLSSIVSKRHTAIQYALLSSLTSLVGTLGRGAVGEAFDHYGYAPVFRWTAAAGVVSLGFVALEGLRRGFGRKG